MFDEIQAFNIARDQLNASSEPTVSDFDNVVWGSGSGQTDFVKIGLIGGALLGGVALLAWAVK